jgi:hypothetical protein
MCRSVSQPGTRHHQAVVNATAPAEAPQPHGIRNSLSSNIRIKKKRIGRDNTAVAPGGGRAVAPSLPQQFPPCAF